MLTTPVDSTRAPGHEVHLTRVFDAHRELLYKAFTDPNHIANWWGPAGAMTSTQVMAVRPSGVWRFVLHGPDGEVHPSVAFYKEVVPNDHLVYVQVPDGDAANRFRVTVTFVARGPRTEVTLRAVWPTKQAFTKVARYAAEADVGMLDRLAEYLPWLEFAGEELVFTWTFAARCELVYRAWTDPTQFAQWWSPPETPIAVHRFEVQLGGVALFQREAPDGTVEWVRFLYQEVVPNERLEFTSAMSDAQGGLTRDPRSPMWPLQVTNALTFLDHGATTTVRLESAPLDASPAERATFRAGRARLRWGLARAFDQLAEHLAVAPTTP